MADIPSSIDRSLNNSTPEKTRGGVGSGIDGDGDVEENEDDDDENVEDEDPEFILLLGMAGLWEDVAELVPDWPEFPCPADVDVEADADIVDE